MLYNGQDKGDVQMASKRLEYFATHGKRFELKEVRKKRSLSQNRYLHLILTWFGLHFGYSKEEAKDIFKRYVNKDYFYYEKKSRVFYKSTADLNSKEMTICIERFRNLSSSQGCYLPNANEQDMLDSIRNEIDKYESAIYT